MSKTVVQKQFGANAAAYATSSVHAKGASLARVVELVGPKPQWRALDVATGGGHMALAVAPHVAEVVASDLTPEMLSTAAGVARERGITNISFAPADAEALPFGDASFDLVTCRIAPHHFPDIARFVAEAARVLKPGGTFALVDNVSPDGSITPGYGTAELSAAAEAYNAFEALRDPSHGRALTVGEWIDVVARTGFTIRHRELMPKGMDFDTWCSNMSVPAATVPVLAGMLDAATPALRDFLEPRIDDGKRKFTLLELVLIATR